MYCPRCGLQVSDTLRFCSRCGLKLEAVALLVINNGVLEQADAPPEAGNVSSKRKRMRQGAKLMFLSGALTPIFIGFSLMDDSPDPLIIPFSIFMISLIWMLYFRLFGDDNVDARGQGKKSISEAAPPKAIPASPSEQVIDTPPRSIKTGDLAHPPSITEGTTELFDRQ